MYGVKSVAAAVFAVVLSVQCPALAEDEPEAGEDAPFGSWFGSWLGPLHDPLPEPSLDPTAEASPAAAHGARFLLFAGTDLWRHGGFANGGVLFAANGLDREGLVFKLMLGAGVYRFTSGALGNIDVAGTQFGIAAMPGWRFIRNGFIVTMFAGVDYQHHRLAPDDPSASLRGSAFGLRAAAELWYEPTPRMMVAADASVSTVGPSYSARLAVGWRLFDFYYVGPEVQGFAAGDNYHQTRVGVHVTGFKRDPFEWSAGLGWANDSDDRSSLYGKLGVITRR